MRRLFGFVGVVGAVAGAIAWQACTSPAAPGGILLTGYWGSDQGRLTAMQVSTQFTGACGSGNTSEPILLDKHGRFDMVGLYGENGKAQSGARFTGAVSEKKMTLRVMLADSSEAYGPMTLNLGQQPALASCH
jgi:hypothetical protein